MGWTVGWLGGFTRTPGTPGITQESTEPTVVLQPKSGEKRMKSTVRNFMDFYVAENRSCFFSQLNHGEENAQLLLFLACGRFEVTYPVACFLWFAGFF